MAVPRVVARPALALLRGAVVDGGEERVVGQLRGGRAGHGVGRVANARLHRARVGDTQALDQRDHAGHVGRSHRGPLEVAIRGALGHNFSRTSFVRRIGREHASVRSGLRTL